MDIKFQLKALETLYGLFGGKHESYLQKQGKPEFSPRDNTGIFEELLPEQVGVRSEGLLKMFSAISESAEICPHSMLVLRNGKLIAKADWSPFTSAYPHVSHSLCKSITSMAAGIAIKEKYIALDEKIADIFETEMSYTPHKYMKDITIRHLLIMSSGVKFNEAGMLFSRKWREDYLSSEVLFEPGSDFMYNSMNSYMLSAAISKRTGISLSEYLNRRLFRPMGINEYYWEKCPEEIEKGGWGLYMNIYDYAKLGQLYLNGGVWNGLQLVPAEWVKESSSAQIMKADSPCYNGYGYQMWLSKGKNGYVFSGMLGQNVFVFPKRNMVIAMTAGSPNLFPRCRAMNIISEFIGTDAFFSSEPIKNFRYNYAASLRSALSSAKFAKPLETKERQGIIARLRKSLSRSRNAYEIPEAAEILNGIEIAFEKNHAGILPVLIQVMNGIFESGIEKIAFQIKSEMLMLKINNSAVIPVSFSDMPSYFDYECSGNIFRVGVNGEFTSDEDDFPVLKILLCFIETACTKVLKFIFAADGITLKIRESPQLYEAFDEAAEMIMPKLGKTVQKTVSAILETDVAEYKIKSFLEPTLKGKFLSL